MLLVISTKGCHLHTWGEKTIIQIILVQKFTRDTLPWKDLNFAQIHKSAKGMILQYSVAALVRDADIEMAISNSLVAMIDQVHNPSGHTRTLG